MLPLIVWNLALGVIWMFLTEKFTLPSLLIGCGLGLLLIVISEQIRSSQTYARSLGKLSYLIGLFLWRVLQANLVLAWEIIKPRSTFYHAFVAVDVGLLNSSEKVILGYMISLTPGSLSLDFDSEHRYLYVHTLYGKNYEATIRQAETFIRLMSDIRTSLPSHRRKDA